MLAAATFDATDAVLAGVVLVLLVAAALLALAETSLVRTTRVKARTLKEEGRRGSGRLLELVERPEEFLSPVLLLVLLCQLVSATLIGIVAQHLFGALGVVVATVLEVIFIFVLGEATPKNWAVRNPDRAALLSAPLVRYLVVFPPVKMLSKLLIGLANVLMPNKSGTQSPFVSERELLAMADVAVEEDVIEGEERALIQSIIEFGDTVVREVMVPRPDMVAIGAASTVAHVIGLAIAEGFSRIPVYDRGIDDVIGIAYTKDLLRAESERRSELAVRELVRPAHYVPETKKVAELMREMQAEKFHIAIVVDEYGGTAGLVTLEDLIEELVGEIVDEFDVEEPLIEPLPGGAYRVNARMPIDEVNELVGAGFAAGDWDTVGGLVFNVLGHVPQEGESAEVAGYHLTAEKVQGRRIGRVRIARSVMATGDRAS
ncbi:MAG: hemolysin family protein [Acidimicrobiales bacterium]